MRGLHRLALLCSLLVVSACADTATTPPSSPSFVVPLLPPSNKIHPFEFSKKTIVVDIPDNFLFRARIVELSRLFLPYVTDTRIVIKTGRDGWCNCFQRPREVVLPSLAFLDPLFPKEGESHTTHEILHVVEIQTHSTSYAKQHAQLQKAFDKFVTTGGYRPHTIAPLHLGTLDIEYNQLFSLVDESSYGGKHPSWYGRPYSNHEELFASLLTVTRVFPDRFLDRLKQLSRVQKRAVAAAYFASINILLAIHSDKNDLKKLLPAHNRIVEALLPYRDFTSQ